MITDLTKAECEDVLAASHYGHLGCCDGDEPYVVPITCVYKDGTLYSFTHEGKKIELLRKNPKMCVQVERVKSGNEWESVMCWGLFEMLTDEKNILEVKLLLAEQHGHAVLSGKATPVSPMVDGLSSPEGDPAIVYCMKPYKMTGKTKRR